MKRTLLFKLVITLAIFIFSSDGQACLCSGSGNILQCDATNPSSTVNTDLYSLNGYNSISIIYTGHVVLNLTSTGSAPLIVIKPIDASDNHTLQISNINANANRIEIQIYLSSTQVSLPLFTTSSSVIAPPSTLSINVIQNITDATDFKIFDTSSLTTVKFANYELIFDQNSTNSGILNFPNLIHGLRNVSSILISGNNHYLAVDSTQMPSSINVNLFSLIKLRLYDQILYNMTNLKVYSIEQCEYNRTAQFLNSNQVYNLSLIMKNNNPLDSVLPNGAQAFQGLQRLLSLTLIEPKLNSSCLRAITPPAPVPDTLILEVGSYYKSDFDYWITYQPLVKSLTINNITDLTIFSVKYFNGLDAIQNLILQGSFNLNKSDLCIFTGITLQFFPSTKVFLNSSKKSSQDWDQCADTYITAINIYSVNDVFCPPGNTCQDCEQWSNATHQCGLISYENNCGGIFVETNKPFTYNNSYLYLFFQQRSWLNRTTYPPPTPIPKVDAVNIGAIIGAVCGLLIAIIILGITICCIQRYRQKDGMKYMPSAPEAKYKHSSDDSTHVSIATSKTSQSSRYALQKSFFPPMQPNDEIAPPLYTAPSESVGARSTYKLPSAPPAPRDSVSTHTTHLYETLDP